MTDFKIGDRVICLEDLRPDLSPGEVYTVREVNSNYLYIDGLYGGWNKNRFEREKYKSNLCDFLRRQGAAI